MRVLVVGSGYVGLVTGACLAEIGHSVICVDRDASRTAMLKNGLSPIFEPVLDLLIEKNLDSCRLIFSGRVEDHVQEADVIVLAVGTPPRADGSADLTQIRTAAAELAPYLNEFTVVVTKSTVPVGTNDDIEQIILKNNPAANVAVVSNPEFLREGSAVEDFMKPDRIVIGLKDERAKPVLCDLYKPLGRDVRIYFTSRRNAELIKYASNAFLAMKVAFINEMADLCEAVGGNVTEVATGMGLDERIGPRFLVAGPGFGGSCFPKDTLALSATARAANSTLSLVDATIEANKKRKTDLSERIKVALGGSLTGRKIAVLGLTFKANTDDVRESPAIDIIRELQNGGANIFAHDPEGMPGAALLLHDANFCPAAVNAIESADACVVLTEWDCYRDILPDTFKRLMKNAIVFDFRNIYNEEQFDRAGVILEGVGRSSRLAAKSSRIENVVLFKHLLRDGVAAGNSDEARMFASGKEV